MQDVPGNRMIAFWVWLYTLLLGTYPVPFRRDYGPQMAQDFRACCRHAPRCHGAHGLLAVWMVALGDLITSVLAERITPVRALTVHERVFLMSPTTLSCSPVGAPRRRVALAIDVVIGPLSVLALWFGTNAFLATLHADGWWSDVVGQSAPTALWLSVVLALSWRGQTVGQALVGLRWVACDGRPARWRSAGELQFWCAGLALALMGGPLLLMFVWGELTWTLARIAHIGLGLPRAWGNGVLPGLVASAVMVLALMWLARRQPAHIVRIAQ